MNILALVGSPRKKGNSALLVQKFSEAAQKKGHQVKTHFVYDLNIKGCIACEACTDGKVEVCVHKDDFIGLAAEIIKADCLVVASPVYMGQITGPLKTLLDRWYTFADEKFNIRHVQGKKLVVMTTSGAPAQQFAAVTEYLKEWFGGFFKLDCIGKVTVGEVSDEGDVLKNEAALREVQALAEKL
jgi:multimeric flavodoxin WrbA